jgi:hypothetical protein
LAKQTLISLARKPKRSWLIPFLTLITGVAFATMMLELMFSPGPLSALAFEGELRSQLFADYGADPLGAKIHELRLTIMDEVLGGGNDQNSGQAPADPGLSDPVPTATDELEQTPTTDPPTAGPPTATDTPIVVPTATASNTPLPTAAPTAATVANCSMLSIQNMWISGDDKLKASVRNDSSNDAFLKSTTLDWPNVPAPVYVDYFELSGPGDDRYWDGYDNSSPTSATGTNRRLKPGSPQTWEADFDDEPDEGIYGSFALTLVFRISGQDCTLSSSTFKAPPATPVPSLAPSTTPAAPSATAPAPTGTPALTETPAPTSTETPTPMATPG